MERWAELNLLKIHKGKTWYMFADRIVCLAPTENLLSHLLLRLASVVNASSYSSDMTLIKFCQSLVRIWVILVNKLDHNIKSNENFVKNHELIWFDLHQNLSYRNGIRDGSVVARSTEDREVRGSNPTLA